MNLESKLERLEAAARADGQTVRILVCYTRNWRSAGEDQNAAPLDDRPPVNWQEHIPPPSGAPLEIWFWRPAGDDNQPLPADAVVLPGGWLYQQPPHGQRRTA